MITDRYVISKSDVMVLKDAWENSDASVEENRVIVLMGAIDMVKEERTRLWVNCCTWQADYQEDGTILVTRTWRSETVKKRSTLVERLIDAGAPIMKY